MARIIDPNPNPEAEKKAICRDGCGATIGYVPNDVKDYHGRDMSGGPDGQEWVDCPQCGKKIIIRSW